MTLPPWGFQVVDLYFQCARYASPLTGRVLPCGGAVGDQPAALMDAFLILESLDANKQ